MRSREAICRTATHSTMRHRTIILLLLGSLFLAGAGVALRKHVDVLAVRKACVVAEEQNIVVQRELRQAKTALAEAERMAAAAEQLRDAARTILDELLAAQKKAGANSSRPVPVPAARPAASVHTRLVASHPEYRQLSLRHDRLRDGILFMRLYQKLSLSPQQIEVFEAARAEWQQVSLDVAATAHEKGVSARDPSVRAILKQAKEACDAKIRGLLGETGFAEYRAYAKEVMGFGRQTANRLASDLFDMETNVTSQELDVLVRLIEANSTPQKNGPHTTDWDAVLIQSRGVLPSSLLPDLKLCFESREAGRRMNDYLSKLYRGEP